MDRYLVSLPRGRWLTLSADQLRRLARGLGDEALAVGWDQRQPPIVDALALLAPDQRADALNVILRRYGDKKDVETIAQLAELDPWRVWELEGMFRSALARARARAAVPASGLRQAVTPAG